MGALGHRLLRRPACWPGWRPSGGGGPGGGPQGKLTDKPRHGVRPGAGGMAQVRPLLGHRDARGADGATAATCMDPAVDAGAGGREHDHGRADPRRHLHRRLRAGRGHVAMPSTSCRPTPAWTSTSTWTGPAAAFLAPFCAPDVAFDFRLPRVKSISASGHKFGLAPLGVGWVVWRDARRTPRGPDLPRQLPGRRHAGLPDQLLPSGRARSSRSYYNFLRLGP